MSSARRGHPPLTVPMPSSSSTTTATVPNDLPPISAIFLIDFDVKAGYTIVWKRAEPGLELDGLVEYKSLPSGLHTVREDLIYFVHDGEHAGLSAFVNEPCEEEEARHARMIAVGVLVPLSYGRLGRAWRHAEGLQAIAHKLAKDRKDTDLLEEYWTSHKAKDAPNDEPQEPKSGETPLANQTVRFPDLPAQGSKKKGHTRNRSASDGATLAPPEHKLSPHHPAWSLTSLLDTFGPLIFPIYRAALLRKRILISCHAPVHQVCDFVYDLSILSNIPLSVNDLLPTSAPTKRLRPLFNIGVHDIPFLTEDYEASKRRSDGSAVIDDDESGSGWVACTTDSILAMKDTLWDMLITIPPDYSANAHDRVWPTVECPRGHPVKATQRDLRRFNALRTGLERLATATPGYSDSTATETSQTIHGRGAAGRPSTSQSNRSTTHTRTDAADMLIEPLSWTALAYNGFMWWASAGEQLRSEENEESARDAALLADLALSTPGGSTANAAMSMPQPAAPSRRGSEPLADSLASLAARRTDGDGEAQMELAIIAYFHRLTSQTLLVMCDLIDNPDEEYTDTIDYDDEEDQGRDGSDTADDPAREADRNPLLDPHQDRAASGAPSLPDDDDMVPIDSRSIEHMGLDIWSAGDAVFVQELAATYFGRRVHLEGKGVEVCGVRVC